MISLRMSNAYVSKGYSLVTWSARSLNTLFQRAPLRSRLSSRRASSFFLTRAKSKSLNTPRLGAIKYKESLSPCVNNAFILLKYVKLFEQISKSLKPSYSRRMIATNTLTARQYPLDILLI